MKILKLFLFTCLIFFLSAPSSSQAKVFNAQSFTLDNGLEVIIVPNDRAPVITSMIWYKVGAADEPQGLSGMAHYFEHLMFKGTEKLSPGEFSRIVKKLGGNDNAFTGQDFTAYFQTIAVQHLDKMLAMEADRMINLRVPQEHFDSEKKVVIEERRQRTENEPKGLFAEQMRSALFVNHPYGTPVIGWMNEIEGYEWDDVKIFYDKWYAPNNAIIIISGDVTAKTARPLIEKHFANLKPKDIPKKRIRPKVPKAIGDTKMTLHHATIRQPSFTKMFIAPSFQHHKKDALALQVMEQILSGGATTRLYKKLVVEEKKAISANFSYNATALDYGTISLSATPTDDNQDLDNLIQDIENEIQSIIDDGVSPQELNDAKQQLIDSAVYARDSLSGPAMIIGQNITTGSTLDDIENWPEMIKAITAEDIQNAAATYLNFQNPWLRPPVTGYLYPEKQELQNPEDKNKEDAQ